VAISLPVQLGGGIRRIESRPLARAGIMRVILGTAALNDPAS
jgi:phosphoribosylformimino-5-aminoimidazole carboxamide ribonucleotide (ProFAR) isomerase